MKKITCILFMLLYSTWLYAKDGKQAFGAATTLQFLENSGQITDQHKQPRKDIDFKVDAGGLTIFGGSAALHYQWVQHQGSPMDSNMQTETYRMDVVLLGANKNAKLLKEELQPYYENYYYPHCKDGATAQSYRRMVYKDVYPNIDWVIYTTGKELKYDFVVHRGGNPADIQLQYSGATTLQLQDGAFTATTPMGSITEEAPYSYVAGSKKQVKSAYKLQGDVLSFDVRSRDEELVIDPNIVWVTYYGGSGREDVSSIVADDSDKVYIIGNTSSNNNISTTGAWRTTYLPNIYGWDGYIACFTNQGIRQWGTYFGSFMDGHVTSTIAIDTVRDCLYVTGITTDTVGIATTGAHQTVHGGGKDAFLTKLNLTGFRVWTTYYGGAGNEKGVVNVETDYLGNVYLYGKTNSSNNIATPGSYKSSGSGAYLVKFNTAGIRQWATYLCLANYLTGGTNDGDGRLLKTSRNGDVYIAGTSSYLECVMGTAGTHRPNPIDTNTNGYVDVWLGKFTPSGSLAWGTYYGGKNSDWPNAIGVANNGDVYMTGTTTSDTGIATLNAFRTLKHTASFQIQEGFLVRFDSLGRRIWGTYMADSNVGYAGDWLSPSVIISEDNKVYVSISSVVPSSSWTNHELVTPDGFQTSRSSNVDIVLAMFDTSGKRLWGSYLGSNGYDGYGGSADGDNKDLALTNKYLYLGSTTTSTAGLAGGAGSIHQTTFGGSYDAFIAQLSLDTTVRIRLPFTDTLFCPGDSFKVKYKVNFPFRSGNVFSVQLSNASGSFASPTVIGTKTTNTDDSITYVIPRTASAGNGYRIRVIASAPADTSPDVGVNIRIKPLPANVLASTNAPVCAGDTLRLSGSSANTDVTWSWAGAAGFTSSSKDTFRAAPTTAHSGNYIVTANRSGCIVKDTVTVLIKPRPDTPDAFNNGPLCTGDVINLTGSSPTSGVTYQWIGPGGFTSTAQNPVRTGAVTAYGGVYKVYTTLSGCAALFYDSTTVVVHPVTQVPSASANTQVCVGQDLQLMASTVAGASYVWSGPGGFSSPAQNPLLLSSTTAFAGKYYVYAVQNNCLSARDSVTVVVNPSPTVSMYPSPKDSICAGGTVNFISAISNTGTSFVRTWYKNNNVIGGAANANYSTSAVADMDEFYVSVTVYGVCATPYTVDGNKIKMRVLPWLTPSATITANPTGTVKSGTIINFNANAVNGGTKPAYQWLRNGAGVTGAISNTWGAATLSNNDQICVDVTSNYLCPNPKTVRSNCIKLSIESTGVVGIWAGKEPDIYPNPVKEILHIEGVEKGTMLKLYDAGGKLVLSETSTGADAVLNLAGVASGNYLLRISTDAGNSMSVKVVKE